MFNQDFREFVELLNDHNVRYLVVGGYAVSVHGRPRYTKDLDIWIDSSKENARQLVQVLDLFGLGSLGLRAEDFQTPDQIVQLGYPPSRIDLLTTVSGINFADCYPKRIVITLDSLKVNFIDLENLKKNKKATGRTQDLADLENL